MDGSIVTGRRLKMNKPFVNPVSTQNLLEEGKDVIVNTFLQIPDLLSKSEISRLNNFICEQECVPVGLDGIKDNYQKGDRIGSYRLSIYNKEMADILWHRIYKASSFLEEDYWVPIGVNPLFRVIVYKEGGELIPHYDAPYIQDGNIMTRKSMVIYLTDNTEGTTDFLYDDQDESPIKDYSDRPGYQGKLMASFIPVAGSSLIFNHRVLHSVKSLESEEKTIIRTDIMYKRK